MFSLLYKEETAHEDGLWCCNWGRIADMETGEASKEAADTAADANPEATPEGKPPKEPVEFVVSGGLDDKVRVWDVREDNTLKMRHLLKGHSLGVVSVAVSSDGELIASTSLESTLCIWKTRSGALQHLLAMNPVDLWGASFSPCNRFVISGSHDGKISMYNVDCCEVEQVLDPQNGKFTLSIAYSPDGKYIASGSIDGIITIFDVATGKVAQTLEGHAMPVRSLCFSPNSQMLLTASDDGHMKLYDVAHSDVAGTLSGHASWVLCVSFSQDGKHFASSSSDHTVKIWDFAERKCLHTFAEHTDQAWGVSYNFSNDKVVSGSEDKSLNLYHCPPNSAI